MCVDFCVDTCSSHLGIYQGIAELYAKPTFIFGRKCQAAFPSACTVVSEFRDSESLLTFVGVSVLDFSLFSRCVVLVFDYLMTFLLCWLSLIFHEFYPWEVVVQWDL